MKYQKLHVPKTLIKSKIKQLNITIIAAPFKGGQIACVNRENASKTTTNCNACIDEMPIFLKK